MTPTYTKGYETMSQMLMVIDLKYVTVPPQLQAKTENSVADTTNLTRATCIRGVCLPYVILKLF